jgi:preprotein translocase subunit YajC
MGGTLIFIVLLGGAFWLLLLRPQRAGARRQRELLANLQPGDEIVSAGGLYGVIRTIDDDDLEVEIADGLIVRMARGAVAGIVEHDDPGAEATDEGSQPS